MATIQTNQTVMAVCEEINTFESPLSWDEIRTRIAQDDNRPDSEVDDDEIFEWLTENAEWTTSLFEPNRVVNRDNGIHVTEFMGES